MQRGKKRATAKTTTPADPTAAMPKKKVDRVAAWMAVGLLVLILALLGALGFYLYTPPQPPAMTMAELHRMVPNPKPSSQETKAAPGPIPQSDGTLRVLPRTHEQGFAVWDPVAVGHVQRLRLDTSDRVYEMKTVALDPPIFVLEDFLTEQECERVKQLAIKAGLFKSDHTYLDGSNLDERFKDTSRLSSDEANKLFRYSDQTWLPPTQDAVLQKLIARATTLAMLPPQASVESMQVVRYGVEGHYESHFDSEADDLGPCCIDPVARTFATGVEALGRPLAERCRLCRVMTILYYLEDTAKGGGTVFPLADMNASAFDEWQRSPVYKQTRECGPGVVVQPRKRQAVMWYNHKVDRGWLGELNPRALHGGCNVKEGVKWIANHWISVVPHPDRPRAPAKRHQ